MSFYLFIAISFYRNIVCKNIVCELGLKRNSRYSICSVENKTGFLPVTKLKNLIFNFLNYVK